jgi:hypothetical protein
VAEAGVKGGICFFPARAGDEADGVVDCGACSCGVEFREGPGLEVGDVGGWGSAWFRVRGESAGCVCWEVKGISG